VSPTQLYCYIYILFKVHKLNYNITVRINFHKTAAFSMRKKRKAKTIDVNGESQQNNNKKIIKKGRNFYIQTTV
jgi:hypothetical protein